MLEYHNKTTSYARNNKCVLQNIECTREFDCSSCIVGCLPQDESAPINSILDIEDMYIIKHTKNLLLDKPMLKKKGRLKKHVSRNNKKVINDDIDVSKDCNILSTKQNTMEDISINIDNTSICVQENKSDQSTDDNCVANTSNTITDGIIGKVKTIKTHVLHSFQCAYDKCVVFLFSDIYEEIDICEKTSKDVELPTIFMVINTVYDYIYELLQKNYLSIEYIIYIVWFICSKKMPYSFGYNHYFNPILLKLFTLNKLPKF
jgi:hypothetical protein